MEDENYELIKEKLEQFDLLQVGREEFLFLECYLNDSIYKKKLIYIGGVSSVWQVQAINRGTATPTPWHLVEQAVWFKDQKIIRNLKSRLGKILSLDKNGFGLFDCNPGTEEEKPIVNTLKQLYNNATALDRTISLYDFGDPLVISCATERDPKTLIDDEGLGFVYVMQNELHNGMLKIGFTNREPRIRAAELTIQSGLNMPYKILCAFLTPNASRAEAIIHDDLNKTRVAKEFFNVDKNRLENALTNMVLQSGSPNLNRAPIFAYSWGQPPSQEICTSKIDEAYRKRREDIALTSVRKKFEDLDEFFIQKFHREIWHYFYKDIKNKFNDEYNLLLTDHKKKAALVEESRAGLWLSEDRIAAALANTLVKMFSTKNTRMIDDKKTAKAKLEEAESDLKLCTEKIELFNAASKQFFDGSARKIAEEHLESSSASIKRVVKIFLKYEPSRPIGFMLHNSFQDNKRDFTIIGLEVAPGGLSGYEIRVASTSSMTSTPHSLKRVMKLSFFPDSPEKAMQNADLFDPYGLGDVEFDLKKCEFIDKLSLWFSNIWTDTSHLIDPKVIDKYIAANSNTKNSG
jgi:hypothetical protein